jgi:hypothetical protein
MLRSSLLSVLLLIAPALCWPESPAYSASRTWGTVVDADSKEPISGALVIALWNLEGGAHWDVTGPLKILEAMSDAEGRFEMPGWGPTRPAKGILDSYDPQVVVVKAGYEIKSVLHPQEPPGRRGAKADHDFVANGQPIYLHKFQGTPEAYAQQIASWLVGGVLGDVLSRGCTWKEIPITVRYLEQEAKREHAAGLRPLRSVSVDRLLAMKQCAPTDDFMKRYESER